MEPDVLEVVATIQSAILWYSPKFLIFTKPLLSCTTALILKKRNKPAG